MALYKKPKTEFTVNKLVYFLLAITTLLAACGAPVPLTQPVVAGPTEEQVDAPIEVVHLKMGYQPFLSSSPFLIGVDDGYFSEQGIELKLVPFEASSDILTALLAGQIDFSSETLSAGAINAVAQSDNLRFVAEKGFVDPASTCPYQVIVARDDLLKDGFINNPENVKGLKFVMTPASIFEYGMEVQLANLGLTSLDVEIISITSQPDRLEALKNDAVDVVTSAEPWITRTKQSGAGDTWVSFGELTPFLPQGVVIYGENLTSNPDVGNRFMVAYLRAIQQYNEGKTDRNIEIISAYTQLSPEDLESACWPTVAADGRTHPDAWMPYQEWMVSKGYLEAVVPFEKLWDAQFVDFANSVIK